VLGPEEFAGDAHALGEAVRDLRGLAGGGGVGDREGDPRGAAVLVVLLPGLVAVELVEPEPRPEGHLGDVVGRGSASRKVGDHRAGAAGQPARHDPAEIGEVELAPVRLAADPNGDQPLGLKAVRGRDRERRVRFALEPLQAGRLRDQRADALDPGRGARGLQIVADEDHEVAAGGLAEGLELDLHARCHSLTSFRLELRAPGGRSPGVAFGAHIAGLLRRWRGSAAKAPKSQAQ
jgi:hypothetical protein